MKEEVYIEMNRKNLGTYLDREQRSKTEDKVPLLRKIAPHNYLAKRASLPNISDSC